jgi:hypothetical protein
LIEETIMPKMKRWGSILISLCLCGFLFLTTGCASQPSPYAQAQQESTQRNAPKAIAKAATQGSEFNQFFPDASDGFERVYTQEKKGFAEAKLKKNGSDFAMLSISDTTSLPTAAAKYAQTTSKIQGYPALEIGTTQTGVLVANRYQVKVLSRNLAFTQSDRQAWIERFDLRGLSKLK